MTFHACQILLIVKLGELLFWEEINNKPLCRDYELVMRAQKFSAYMKFGPIVP